MEPFYPLLTGTMLNNNGLHRDRHKTQIRIRSCANLSASVSILVSLCVSLTGSVNAPLVHVQSLVTYDELSN